MDIAHSREDFKTLEHYLEEKATWEEAIRTALSKTLTAQEKGYIQSLGEFFALEHTLLTEPKQEDKEQWEWQINEIQYNIIVNTRWYLISKENNKLPILNIINEQKLRDITNMFFEEDYIIDGKFDEELRLEKNYFTERGEEDTQEDSSEDKNEEHTPRGSGKVTTTTIMSPYLNGIRGEIKEKYNMDRWEIGVNIKKNIAKFADIFEDKPKIFISVFAERYTQEECKIIVENFYPEIYYIQSLENYINERYEEENN